MEVITVILVIEKAIIKMKHPQEQTIQQRGHQRVELLCSPEQEDSGEATKEAKPKKINKPKLKAETVTNLRLSSE